MSTILRACLAYDQIMYYIICYTWFKARSLATYIKVKQRFIRCGSCVLFFPLVFDKLTNSTVWAAGSREALRTTCMKELSQNTTLKEVTEEGKPSIAEQVKKIACVNECSGNGVCLNGMLKITMKNRRYHSKTVR